MHFAAAVWFHAAGIMTSFSQNMQGDVERGRMSTNLRRQFTPKSKNTCCDLYPFIYLFTFFGVSYQALEITSSGSACVETLNSDVTWATTRLVRMAHRRLMKELLPDYTLSALREERASTLGCYQCPPQLSEAELCRCACVVSYEPPVLSLEYCIKKVNPDEAVLKTEFDLRKSTLQACWLVLTVFSDPVLSISLSEPCVVSPFLSLSCSVGRLSSQGNPRWRNWPQMSTTVWLWGINLIFSNLPL